MKKAFQIGVGWVYTAIGISGLLAGICLLFSVLIMLVIAGATGKAAPSDWFHAMQTGIVGIIIFPVFYSAGQGCFCWAGKCEHAK